MNAERFDRQRSTRVPANTLGRREFVRRAGLLGLAVPFGGGLLAAGRGGPLLNAAGLTATGSPTTDAPDAPVSSAGAAMSLADMESLLFSGPPAPDPTYTGSNEGGTVGYLNTGGFPQERLPWLAIRPESPFTFGYSIFDTAFPLPTAFAERGRLDGECMGIEVLTYDNASDPAKGLQNAELMIQQGVDFAFILHLFPDVNEQIAKLLDDAGIPSLFYAVAPAETKKPFITLPDYGTGVKIGQALGQYVQENWDGEYDLFVAVGQQETGTSEQRMGGAQAGLEEVLGEVPSDKTATIDAGSLEEAQQAMADLLTTKPDAESFIVVGYADVHAVGALRALEAAGRADRVAAGGQPGTPEGLDELRKGPGNSGFVVSYVQDLAFASWPLALATYALAGGTLPDVCAFDAVEITAANIGDLPSQSNEGYSCT